MHSVTHSVGRNDGDVDQNYIYDACLWCSANHNALGQLANKSRLCLSEGGT